LNKNIDVTKELSYVMEALTITRHALKGKVPLIGFSGAPVRFSIKRDFKPKKLILIRTNITKLNIN